MKRNILFTIIILFVIVCFARPAIPDKKQMGELLHRIYLSKSDTLKDSLNAVLLDSMRVWLKNESTFRYNFDSVPHIGIMYSPDNAFRIYNWNIQWNDGTFTYYGFLQLFNKKGQFCLHELMDKSDFIENPENQTLDPQMWFGVLYYQIFKVDDKKTPYYMLLGWDGNNDYSKKKIIEVLYFNANGMPQFGKNVFKGEKARLKRIIFEYSYLANMSLRYYDENKSIIFDHLAPPKPSLTGQYRFYGPDFSYDAYVFNDGKWEFRSNVDARNPKVKKSKQKK